jgi:hypothetical protein
MRGDGLLLRIMATATAQVNITLLLTLKNAMAAANAWSSVRGLLWNW